MSTALDDKEQKEVYKEFKHLGNMTPAALEKWLDTKESKKVGWDSGDGESIGHKSGEKIIKILHTKEADLKEADYKHMQKVNSYIKRHSAQKPDGDVSETNWNYSLKNWGHDYSKNNPLKPKPRLILQAGSSTKISNLKNSSAPKCTSACLRYPAQRFSYSI